MRSPIEPPEAEPLLKWAMSEGFAAWHLVDASSPEVIVLFRAWGRWIDVIHLRGPDQAEAARLERSERADIWRPREIVWHYFGDVVHTITALQGLFEHNVRPYAVPREGEPLPLHISDAELEAKRSYFPPTNYPIEEA